MAAPPTSDKSDSCVDILLPKHYFFNRGFDGMLGTYNIMLTQNSLVLRRTSVEACMSTPAPYRGLIRVQLPYYCTTASQIAPPAAPGE